MNAKGDGHELPDLPTADAGYIPFPSFAEWSGELRREDLWRAALERLRTQRATTSQEDLDGALNFVVRAAAIDTGAIEGLYQTDRGFTYSVAAQGAAWEAAMDERGAKIRPLFDAQLRGYELVLDAATARTPIVGAWIRRLHEELCAAQETYRAWTPDGWADLPLPLGEYKQLPNHVLLGDGSIHSYAPVIDTQSEMTRLTAELGSESFTGAHPVVQAAYAHYAFVAVHPFADGNGRVARALASVFLYRDASIPLLVFSDRRDIYLDALRAGDRGEHAAFTDFVLHASVTALDLARSELAASSVPAPERSLSNIHALLKAQGELTHVEFEAAASRVFEEVANRVNQYVGSLKDSLPPGVQLRSRTRQLDVPELPGFRLSRANPRGGIEITASCSAPASVTVTERFGLQVSRGTDSSESFVLIRAERPDQLVFALADVHPDVSTSAYARIEALVGTTVGVLLSELESGISNALEAAGY